VTRGQLTVSKGNGFFGRRRTVTVAENCALSLAASANLVASDVHPVAAALRDQFLAWRDGMLSFSGQELATAARAFDRYGPTRIIVADPGLARQKIIGLFKADDPQGFATAIAASFGAVVKSQGNILRIAEK
jgi:transmembrane sensor